MKYLTLLLILLTVPQEATLSQPCLPEGITFSTQAQIDNFQADYPGCNEIAGDLVITGDFISNLNGLSVLNSIGGSLRITFNDKLTSCSGLESLNSVAADLEISWNPTLATLSALGNLVSVGGKLEISGNYLLTNFSGLENLSFIGGGMEIVWNTGLVNFEGLNSLASIGGSVRISANNGLINFDGFDNLVSVGGVFEVSGNYAITSFIGLEHLTLTGNDLWINYNPELVSLTGLNNLTSTGVGGISIHDNYALTSIKGLESLESDSIDGIYLCYNTLLSECVVKGICDFLSNPHGSIDILGNMNGCNSPQEVEILCPFGIDESNSIEKQFSVYPNPSSTTIAIELTSSTPANNTILTICNLNTQQLISQYISKSITLVDVRLLPPGVYFVKIQDDMSVQVRKFIKQ
jgi:hypothetical protein